MEIEFVGMGLHSHQKGSYRTKADVLICCIDQLNTQPIADARTFITHSELRLEAVIGIESKRGGILIMMGSLFKSGRSHHSFQ